jgi:hypothetical protein
MHFVEILESFSRKQKGQDGALGQSNEIERIKALHAKITEALATENFAENLAKAGFNFAKTNKPKLVQELKDEPYCVIGIDGSQVYPSRHLSHIKAGLIKTAAVIFNHTQKHTATFETKIREEVFFHEDLKAKFGTDIFPSESLFDCLRHLEELRLTLEIAWKMRATPYWQNSLILLDSTLNLNFLNNFSEKLEQTFLAHYTKLLSELKKTEINVYSYTSWPNNSSICKAMKNFFCQANYFSQNKCCGNCESELCKYLSFKSDAELFACVLQNGEQSAHFQQTFFRDFPCKELLAPFFYLATEDEVARVDFLEGNKNAQTNFATTILIEQIQRGFGYPLALTEAHVAADITSAEKTFFSDLLNNNGNFSPKLRGKKNIFG